MLTKKDAHLFTTFVSKLKIFNLNILNYFGVMIQGEDEL